jgi:DNA-binding NtrC family response regulator
MAKILIVDDDASFRGGLAETLSDLGHESLSAASGEAAFEQFANADLVFLDLRLGGMDGMELLRRIRPDHPHLPVVILTAYADSANTIEAMKLGAFDHLTKPIGREDVKAVLARALSRPPAIATHLAPENGELIGASPAMREVQKLVGVAASSDATVLIQGETGTGKELVARAIHGHGARATKPFVAMNCAAIPAELLESELFGHVRGAFTGALQSRAGRFKEANGGTLFLDEIGDMTMPMQAKILRVLQDHLIVPVGGSASQHVDVRILAATHHDLIAMVRNGGFREDLFYRLHVLTIRLPPLRERGSDILALAEYFLQCAPSQKKLTAAAAKVLLEYSWPGNVRELENLLQSTSLTVRGTVIDGPDLKLMETDRPASSIEDLLQLNYPAAIARLERMLLQHALQSAGGNRTEAARKLGIRRQFLYAKLKEHGL